MKNYLRSGHLFVTIAVVILIILVVITVVIFIAFAVVADVVFTVVLGIGGRASSPQEIPLAGIEGFRVNSWVS